MPANCKAGGSDKQKNTRSFLNNKYQMNKVQASRENKNIKILKVKLYDP